jgi:hypothetical protein
MATTRLHSAKSVAAVRLMANESQRRALVVMRGTGAAHKNLEAFGCQAQPAGVPVERPPD